MIVTFACCRGAKQLDSDAHTEIMGPDPDLVIDIDSNEARSESLQSVVLPWSGQSLTVRIPAGVSDGTTLLLHGIAPPTVPGGQPRDAVLQIRIRTSPDASLPPAPFGAASPPPFGAGSPPPNDPGPPPFGAGPPAAPYGAGPPPFGVTPPAAPFGVTPPAAPYGAGSQPPYGVGPPAAPYGAGPQPPYGAGPPAPPFGAMPPAGQFGATPPPSARSRRQRRLIIAGAAGAVCLAVLLTALVVPRIFASDDKPDRPSSGSGALDTPSDGPSPSAEPVSPAEYRALLAAVDKSVVAGFGTLASAKNPKAVGAAVDGLETAVDTQRQALAAVVPPTTVAAAHDALVSGLQSLAESLAETGSAAGSGEVCAGPSAVARISRESAADELRAAKQALATADPANPYQVGAFVPKETADSNRRLGNGSYLRRVRGGSGQLKIENGGSDAVINLVLGSAKTPAVSVYVRGKGKLTVSGVKDGTYRVFMTSGKDWDGKAKAFSRDCSFQKFEDTFKFTTNSGQYTVWTITLTPVLGGNARTSDVDPGAFPTG